MTQLPSGTAGNVAGGERLPLSCLNTSSGVLASIFRSSGGGAARERRRRPVPRQYRPAASRRHRTSVRLTRSSPVQLRARMHPGLIAHHGPEQGSTPVGGSTTPLRQRSRGAASWDGPGPALSRGPSFDGLKTDSTADRRSIVAGRRSGAGTSSTNCPLKTHGVDLAHRYSLHYFLASHCHVPLQCLSISVCGNGNPMN